MKTEASIEVGRPIEEVFQFTTEHVAEWSLTVVEDEVIEEKPDGTGTRFRLVTEDRGRRMEFDGVVTRHEPPTAHTVSMKGTQFDIEADYRFEDLGGRTRVTLRSDVQAKGLFKVMFFFLGRLMKKSSCDAQDRELGSLKQRLEAQDSQPSE